jgi:hypothetical protein
LKFTNTFSGNLGGTCERDSTIFSVCELDPKMSKANKRAEPDKSENVSHNFIPGDVQRKMRASRNMWDNFFPQCSKVLKTTNLSCRVLMVMKVEIEVNRESSCRNEDLVQPCDREA